MKVDKIYLDKLYNKYKNKNSSKDPIWFLHSLKSEKDVEATALISSAYAYGLIDVMNVLLNTFYNRINNKPYEFIINFNRKNDLKYLNNLHYRFNNVNDLLSLIENIKNILIQFGSLQNLFLSNYSDSDENILNALKYFAKKLHDIKIKNTKAYYHLIPDVSKNSTCKRLNLFLRWMVRKDEIDLGIWSKSVSKSKLIIPVDTHVYQISRNLGLINRKSCDMKFAIELTNKLKEFDKGDPVKYDFALCHQDI